MKKRILGIEFGSTRIKAVITDERGKALASGSYAWENELVDGLWSYPMDKVETGLHAAYKNLVADYGETPETYDAIGISAMMHGYLAFDRDYRLLAPFRTWRNTNTPEAAAELSELFNFNVPMRWSVSQYYQSVLDGLPHVKNVAHLFTLSGYVHFRLTGKNVMGINDASGMFPCGEKTYDGTMLSKFNKRLKEKGYDVDFENILPEVMLAGENAGYLTEEGAKLIDETGTLRPGILFCPPEGDMGTGMVATNSVRVLTANISSGTSANIDVVLDKPLSKPYSEIDILSTPDGHPSALVHINNCTCELDTWVNIFAEAASLFGGRFTIDELYRKLYEKADESDEDVGGIAAFNYLAGEPLGGTYKGLPAFAHLSEGKMTLASFIQAQIYSAIAGLSLGYDILLGENVRVNSVNAHGGYYKVPKIGQTATSAMIGAPVTVMDNAGEGGAWGMALLALYATDNSKPLPEFLDGLFSDVVRVTIMADEHEQTKFRNFMTLYKKLLPAEALASEAAGK